MTDSPDNAYTKEAVQKRLSARRRRKEASGYWPAFILDLIVLLGSLYAFWMAFSALLPDGRTQWLVLAFIGSPALFVISRFVRSRPTLPGWIWLAVSFLALIAIIFLRLI